MINQHCRMLKPIFCFNLRDRTETETAKPVHQLRNAITPPTDTTFMRISTNRTFFSTVHTLKMHSIIRIMDETEKTPSEKLTQRSRLGKWQCQICGSSVSIWSMSWHRKDKEISER